MRKPLIAGNWKMFMNAGEAKKLINDLCATAIDFNKVDVLIAPSFTNLSIAHEAIKAAGKPVILASQNVYTEDSGAFTGEVSLPMLESVGVTAVIVGHSERRTIFNETDELINKKVHKIVEKNMTAILCVGELLEERESNVAVEVVVAQLGKCLNGIKELSKIVIAYEPVWAIGTGKTASPADAQAMHHEIRKFIERVYGKQEADKVKILYGGSVKPENAKELMAQQDIDGALVGGASLKADMFSAIINH